jgi:DNA-binding MarR family transcriptional regulator/GNAT superfamily N-acetyltransferase
VNSALFAEVFDLAMEMEALGRRAARAVTREGLLEVDARLLIALLYSEQSQAQLARALAMDTGQIARTVRRLTDKALIKSLPITGSRRRTLGLTQLGRQEAFEAERRKVIVIEEYLEDEAKHSKLFEACKALSDRHYTDYAGPFVRAAGVGEFGSFLRIAATTLQHGYYGHFDERIEAYLAQSYIDYLASKERGLFLIAEYQGDIRGGLIATPRTPTEAHIPMFAVDFHYPCRSIGTALFEAAAPQLRALGYSSVSTLAPRDPDGSSFFKHREWIHAGIRKTADFGPMQTLDEWRQKL